MVKLVRTDSGNPDFIALVKLLDADLAEKDGDDHAFYAQFNKIDSINYVVVAYLNDNPVGCGAIKEFDQHAMEVKRMFTSAGNRGLGIASKVLTELEKWAKQLTMKKCVLETGIRQYEAIRLYEKSGYTRIPNYGQYKGVEDSRCYEKVLRQVRC